MDDKFREYVNKMQGYLEELEQNLLLDRLKLGKIPKSGIYVFHEKGKPFYVGRSNRMRERILEHGRPSSDHYSATLAFRMAIKSVGIGEEELKQCKRSELEKRPEFKRIFTSEKSRVSSMKVKTVGITDQIEQALFEIYAALKLETLEYNDFGTH